MAQGEETRGREDEEGGRRKNDIVSTGLVRDGRRKEAKRDGRANAWGTRKKNLE